MRPITTFSLLSLCLLLMSARLLRRGSEAGIPLTMRRPDEQAQ